jgi:DNA-binding NarL/FixJ family response regulator
VDDHALVRWSLRQLFMGQRDVEVCGEADSEEEAFQLLQTLQPDVVLVDIRLKAGNGLNLIQRAKAANLGMRFLVISSLEDEGCAEQALLAGAVGFIGKSHPAEKIAEAARRVLAGEMHFDKKLLERFFSRSLGTLAPRLSTPESVLSPRELEIFRYIGEGTATQEVAQRLNINASTVDTYRERIKTKLKLKSGADLANYAIRWNLRYRKAAPQAE